MHYFDVMKKADYEQAVISVYFAFTSLSTVGLETSIPEVTTRGSLEL